MIERIEGQESFARREVVASTGLWERGAEASGAIPPSARLLPPRAVSEPPKELVCPPVRALKADATSPSGETGLSAGRALPGKPKLSPTRSAQGVSIGAGPVRLDNLASNVSPTCPTPGDPGREAATTSPNPDRRRNLKRNRYQLRRRAGRILGGRVARCGRKIIQGTYVTLHDPGDDCGHHYGGLETCASVWNCPVCAVKITERRRQDIDQVLTAHRAAGGLAAMVTLTVPHHRFQSCRELRSAVAAAWRQVKNGKAWVCARQRHGWHGDVRVLEVTHGENGWHPHLHIFVFLEPGRTKHDAYSFGGWLFHRWAAAVQRLGFGECSHNAFAFDIVRFDQGAADYVCKWGAARELTQAHVKRSQSGRTPWQILEDCARGSRQDEALFSEYAAAFKGARQLTWSRGLRDRYLDQAELPDEEAAAPRSLPETHRASIRKDLWAQVCSTLSAEVLFALDDGGVPDVVALLQRRGYPVAVELHPSLEPGRRVPCLILARGQARSPPGPPTGAGHQAGVGPRADPPGIAPRPPSSAKSHTGFHEIPGIVPGKPRDLGNQGLGNTSPS